MLTVATYNRWGVVITLQPHNCGHETETMLSATLSDRREADHGTNSDS